MWYSNLILVLFTTFHSLFADQRSLQLQTVVVLFRHGDRTPVDPYPNDPFKDRSNWPVGFGQLTPRGKMMQFNLGKFLRNRYGNFLSDQYDENDIYVRSSDVDRTLMSAMSNLAGLYPPKEKQIWNPDLMWQPIPVHTVPLEDDNIIGNHANCPRLERLGEQVNDLPEIRQIVTENDWVFKYLTENSGRNMTSLWDIDFMYDCLFIESLYNKTLPDWTKKVFPDEMKTMADLSFTLSTYTQEMKRLRGGPIIQSILDHFHNFIAEQHQLKMLMYSGHDTTLSSLLNSLGMFDPPIGPPYASAILIELKKSPDSQYFVSFSYRNDTTRQPYDLYLHDCPKDCPLVTFNDLTKSVRPDDWIEECGISLDPTAKAITTFSIGVSLVIVAVLLTSVIITCVRAGKTYVSPPTSISQTNDYKYFSIN